MILFLIGFGFGFGLILYGGVFGYRRHLSQEKRERKREQKRERKRKQGIVRVR